MNWRAAASATVFGLAAIAASRASDSPAGFMACRDLADASTRLACYDRAAAALANATAAAAGTSAKMAPGGPPPVPPSTRQNPQPAQAAAAPANPAPVLTPEQQFGLPAGKVAAQEVAAGTRAADAAKIEARLAGISGSADGRAVFVLDNGQVWRQLAAEGELLAKVGDGLTISRGLLGSYWLQLSTGRGCKVTRLR